MYIARFASVFVHIKQDGFYVKERKNSMEERKESWAHPALRINLDQRKNPLYTSAALILSPKKKNLKKIFATKIRQLIVLKKPSKEKKKASSK